MCMCSCIFCSGGRVGCWHSTLQHKHCASQRQCTSTLLRQCSRDELGCKCIPAGWVAGKVHFRLTSGELCVSQLCMCQLCMCRYCCTPLAGLFACTVTSGELCVSQMCTCRFCFASLAGWFAGTYIATAVQSRKPMHLNCAVAWQCWRDL
jgi:hypothetical protein